MEKTSKIKTLLIFVALAIAVLVIFILLFTPKHYPPQPIPPEAFVSVWDTRNNMNDESSIPGASDKNQIKLPLVSDGNYDFTVYWGDGKKDVITQWNQPQVTHTYNRSGVYEIVINGTIEGWRFITREPMFGYTDIKEGDASKILEIKQWGNFRLSSNTAPSMESFQFTRNLNIIANDKPDLSGIINMTRFFSQSGVSMISNMNNWDVSSVRYMDGMFRDATSFNQPLNNWDVSSVESMNEMFRDATSFNQPLNNWDVSSVSTRYASFAMFMNATSFNQPLNNWDVSNITRMDFMFSGATSFNQPLNNWKTSNVVNMVAMFRDAQSFDQDLGDWDVSNVEDMKDMFYNVKLSTKNYDSLLMGWASLPSLQSNVSFGGGDSMYCEGVEARQFLIDEYGWTINDGGMDPECT